MTYFPPTPGLIGLILRMTWDTDTKTDTDLKTQTCMWIYGRKMKNTSPEQPMGAINLVWAIHHFPYHLKMSFGPARRLGLGSLGSR